MTSAPRARKISKPMAMARFIEVTIDLLETLPISEVSDHLIADTAQISRSSIYRYFNTRLELFDLVLDTLIQNYLADLQVVATPFAQPQKSAQVTIDLLAPTFALSSKVFAVGNYLASENYHSDRLRDNITKVVDTWNQQFLAAGVAPRMARALALQSLGLGFGRPNAANLIPLSPDDVLDVFRLMVNAVQSHAEVAAKFGWIDEKLSP